MSKFFRVASLAALALAATALTAQAQEKATELTGGLLGFQYTSYNGGGSTTEFATGGAYAAVGFYLSPGMALEPTIQSSHFSVSDNGPSGTTVGLGLALPYYFNKGWGRKGPYLAPRVLWTSTSSKLCSSCTSNSVSQFGLGAAIGTKVPLNDAAALRIQGSFDYGFDNSDVVSTTAFGISLGLSVFLK
jgi:hypothetical protein